MKPLVQIMFIISKELPIISNKPMSHETKLRLEATTIFKFEALTEFTLEEESISGSKSQRLQF